MTEKAKPTPGPWSVPHFACDDHPCSCAYVLSDSQSGAGAIATVHRQSEQNGEHNEPDDIAAANARLIAAAPEMLDALMQIELISTNAGAWFENDPWNWGQMMGKAATPVILKALGEVS